MPNNSQETRGQQLQSRIKKFTRIEKAFYGSIILTAIIIAVSVVFMQTKLLQVQHDLTDLNVQVSTKQVEINNAKQEINDLTRKERLSGLASSQEMTLQNAIVKTAE